MSARSRAPARSHSRGLRRARLLLPISSLLAMITAGVASAEPPPGVQALTAVEAARSGSTIRLVPRPDLDPRLVEVRLANSWPTARLLAVAPTGTRVAVADRIDLVQATLTVAEQDGSQLRVGMPGLLAAAFSPDGEWLAVIDGAGSLWKVIAGTAAATRLAPGPFLGPLSVEPGGTVLLAAVSSVEAPFVSRLARFDPEAGSLAGVSDDKLVYGSTVLADGSIAVVAHEPHGTVVNLVTRDGRSRLAELGPGAVHVSVSLDGSHVAWEREGGIYLRDIAAGSTWRVAAGSRPRLSRDGRSLLAGDGDATVLLGLDGSRLARFAGAVAFAGCESGCRP
jgi:hypothetical protein